jgi:hypothetical protein
MQFTPSTWADLGRDGDDDGDLDPGNYFDAALAAAAYLCHHGGPLPDGPTIVAQWQQWERQKAALEQRVKAAHAQWEQQRSYRERLTEFVRNNPTATADAQTLAALPPLPPEPVYEEPEPPPVVAQLRRAVEGYYGPEGEVRDDYRDRVEAVFRQLVSATGGVAVTPDDRRP